MDTIQISLILNKEKLEKLSQIDIGNIITYINGIKSEKGYRYCDCFKISNIGNFIVKISYPRFFDGINAYLITNSMECEQVHWNFSMNMSKHSLLCDAQIDLNRVDIPFTFMMGLNYNFNSYRKVYQVLDYVYREKNKKSNPKAYTNVSEYKPETIIYADTPTLAKYNQKVMFYDQYNNLKAKTDDEDRLYELEAKYDNLSRRMRIEVSKRINRKTFSIDAFSQFNIFKEYSVKYKDYILENLFDLNKVNEFYEKNAIELATRLLNYKEKATNFNYEAFIYKEIEHIHDYEILRRALKMCIDNLKTREKAVTSIRKVLMSYQLNENIIVMETYITIKQMRESIFKYLPW